MNSILHKLQMALSWRFIAVLGLLCVSFFRVNKSLANMAIIETFKRPFILANEKCDMRLGWVVRDHI